jgi:hypothetical protein
MPELVMAYEREGNYFAAIRIEISGEPATFECSVEPTAFKALSRVFQCRPLAEMPGVPYRYFFQGSFGRKRIGFEPVTFGVRIEAGRSAKTFQFDGPTPLVANLRWFFDLRKEEKASALRLLAHLKRLE